ncbi:hypothetical protein [Nocardioides exalbidus]|nr:hypothetical protein [Nocardioides exalbidus]
MLRAVRRPLTLGALALVAVGALSGCGGIGQPKPYDSPGINGLVIPTPTPTPADFVDTVDNPWLALEPGSSRHYDVVDSGRTLGSIDAEVAEATEEVAGLDATVVRTTTDIDGETSVDTRFFAQDEDGNVWLVGADPATGDAWRAGEGGAEAGLAMPADPRLGDGWLAYVVPGLPQASTTIEDQSQQVVQTRESGSATTGSGEAGTTTRNMYEKGAGLVSVEDLDEGWIAVRD